MIRKSGVIACYQSPQSYMSSKRLHIAYKTIKVSKNGDGLFKAVSLDMQFESARCCGKWMTYINQMHL